MIYEFPRFKENHICLCCGLVLPSRTHIIKHYINDHHSNDVKYAGYRKAILRRFPSDVSRYQDVVMQKEIFKPALADLPAKQKLKKTNQLMATFAANNTTMVLL
jgi:hypothetical protein